jgi:hypothetical protein
MSQQRRLYFNQKIVPHLWQSYAERMTPIILRQLIDIGRTHLPKTFSKSVVIIETRNTPTLAFTIYNSLLLTDHTVGLELFVSDGLQPTILKLTTSFNNVVVHTIPNITNTHEYTELLVSSKVWNTIQAETILLVQTDAMLLKPFRWESFQSVDYIGSPWNHEPNLKIPWPDKSEVTRRLNPIQQLGTNRVGNGGFSLRRTQAMMETVRQFPYSEYGTIGNVVLPEDLYFSRYASQIASYQLAKTFATETVWNPEAYGMHKIWEYQPVSRLLELLQQHYLQVCQKQPKQQ